MKDHVLLVFVLLLAGKTKGEKCVCTSYWECITTGGSPIAYCGEDANEVCCVQGEITQDNTLNGEGIAPVSQPEQRKTSNGSLLGEPPPPVRLFGDRKVKPIINTAFQNVIPVRQIKTSGGDVERFSEDRSSLDAFPPNLVAPPDIIDPLKRRRKQESTKTTLLSSINPITVPGRGLSFRARANIQDATQGPLFPPRIAVALAPLTDSALLPADPETPEFEQLQPGRPSSPLNIPANPADSPQRTFSFVDSAPLNRRPSESQPIVRRKPKFSFRDTRP